MATYGKRVAVYKSNGTSIYESYKQPYAKPTGYSMDVKVDGIGKKSGNRSILNTADSGISKSNSSNKGTNVVTYSNNKGNSYLRDKREEMYAGMKGDIQKDVPSINKNNNSGYIAAKKEQISTKIKEDKQSTYSRYDKYMKDNYINNKKAEIFEGMKPAYVKISENTKKESGVLDYLKKSGKQILLGNYTKDVTLLGTIGQIGAGLLDIDLPGDIRDIVYDATHLELSWECAGRTALDIIGVLPVVGAIKYGDEVGTVVKNIDNVGDAAKETEIIGSAAKGLPKADEAGKLVDITVKNADTVDDVVKEGDKVTKVAPKGAGNAATGAYNPNLSMDIGDGLGKLSGKSIDVSEKGIDLVKNHIAQFGDIPENTAMIERIQNALKNGQSITGADASFYMHEAAEATMMQKGISYEAAHEAVLQKYGVSPYSVYHPEVIQQFSEWFNQGFKDW